MSAVSDVTRILEAVGRGERQAAEELLPLVYDELRRIAAYKLAHESPGHTLQPTALVHEAWLRMIGDGNEEFDGRRSLLRRGGRGHAAHPRRVSPAEAKPEARLRRAA